MFGTRVSKKEELLKTVSSELKIKIDEVYSLMVSILDKPDDLELKALYDLKNNAVNAELQALGAEYVSNLGRVDSSKI